MRCSYCIGNRVLGVARMMILLLLGDSGSGKTTISKALQNDYNYFNIVKSYTTRFRRNINDKDHIFVRKHNLLYKMFNEDFVASTIINGEIYCSFPEQFNEDVINIYTVDDKGALDVINYFNKEDVLIVRLKRDNIDIDKDRAGRNLNQVIPNSCSNINIVENNMSVHHACLDIISLCSQKWPVFYSNL